MSEVSNTPSVRYATVVVDPPWPYDEFVTTLATGASQNRARDGWVRYGSRTTKALPYASMPLEEIAALPVDSLADKDSRLFLWTTNRYLPDSFELIRVWGFKYRQTLVWHKLNPQPFPISVAPSAAEFLLVATRGTPGRPEHPLKDSVFSKGVPKRHSQKPELFLDLIEQVSPGPYLELFARRQRLGWDTWGNEALEHVELSA